MRHRAAVVRPTLLSGGVPDKSVRPPGVLVATVLLALTSLASAREGAVYFAAGDRAAFQPFGEAE